MPKFTLIQEHPAIYEAPERAEPVEIMAFLFREDLPSRMSLSAAGCLYFFRTREERMQFALGIQLTLDALDD